MSALLWRLAAACLLVAACAGPLRAQERIESYDIQVQVAGDGSLEVAERIRVRAEGMQVRRGLYRDFPTRYRDRYDNPVVIDFEVLDLRRNGQPEPWFTERRPNGVRVNTGNDDLLAVPASHEYLLRYRTTRQLGFFDDHDELYWNAIGSGWAFPVEHASIEVRLPQPVPVDAMRAEGWTGAPGARGGGFVASLPSPGLARWQLTAPLAPGEGFTIALSFPRGVVAAPGAAQRAGDLLRDNSALLVALLGLVALCAYCLVRWRQVGRDPPAGTVIVRYEPPSGISPAGLRYIRRMGYDTRCFSADLLWLGVAGALRIERDQGLLKERWRLEQAGPAPDGDAAALLPPLFAGANTVELDHASATRLQAATEAHRRTLAGRFRGAMFHENTGSTLLATGIMLAASAIAIVLGMRYGGLPFAAVPMLAMLAVVVAFALLVRAPTREGRRVLDHIEGLRRYLSVAEQDDLRRLQPPGTDGLPAEPALDAARFEALLPYAVALEVEDAWTRRFTLAVGAAAAAAATSAMGWYHAGGGRAGDIGGFTRAIGGSLAARIASSSTPPGSSPGGGGGGFSGGGGGGGGGGGR